MFAKNQRDFNRQSCRLNRVRIMCECIELWVLAEASRQIGGEKLTRLGCPRLTGAAGTTNLLV